MTTVSSVSAVSAAMANPTPATFAKALHVFCYETEISFTETGRLLSADRRTISRWINGEMTPKQNRLLDSLRTLSNIVNSMNWKTTNSPSPVTPPANVGSSNRMTEFMTRATPILKGVLYDDMRLDDALMECVACASELGVCFSSAEVVRLIRANTNLRFTHRTAGSILRDNWDQWAPTYVQVSRRTSSGQEVFVYGRNHTIANSYDFEI